MDAPSTPPASAPTIALALGGGGARGLAHIHVIEVLDELGLKPTLIAGSSIGAIMGAGMAAGMTGREIHDYARSVLLGSIQAALQALPPEQRDVFVAHEIEGLSFADMSAQWRVPQNTLLARMRHAVLALRARLRAEYGDLVV